VKLNSTFTPSDLNSCDIDPRLTLTFKTLANLLRLYRISFQYYRTVLRLYRGENFSRRNLGEGG